MTWRIAAVAFVLCFALGSGGLIADEKPHVDAEGNPVDAAGSPLPKSPASKTRQQIEEENQKNQEKLDKMANYLENHFPLSAEDAIFFRDQILDKDTTKAGLALGELMGSIYNKEKERIWNDLEDPSTEPSCKNFRKGDAGNKTEELDFEKLKDESFYRFICSAAKYEVKKNWEGETDTKFKESYTKSRSSKEAANQKYASLMEELKTHEKKISETTDEAARKKLIDERAGIIAKLKDSGFSTEDLTKYAHSLYSKKNALTPTDELSVKQNSSSAQALRAQAAVGANGELYDSVKMGDKTVNVQVGQLGAKPADDAVYTNTALQAIAQEEIKQQPTQKLQPGKDKAKVTSVPYDPKAKDVAVLGPKAKDGGKGYDLDAKFEAPKAVATTQAPPPATAAPKLGEIFKADGDLGTKCSSCHSGGTAITFGPEGLLIGGKARKATKETMAKKMPFFAEVLKTGKSDNWEGEIGVKSLTDLKAWFDKLPDKP